ncbi:MAG: hypothetical protein E7300_00620 [Lachnospiraceae bacterium]|nr:hypothetical protein [Lachnospiraceae bacterium]
MEDTKTNPKYKDRLFSFIFGNEKNKKWTLALYNAVNHSNYTNPDDIEINTIEDFLYMGMKNDVSFLLHTSVSLYEHQSTYNPNMPARQLIYIGQLFDKYIKKNKCNIYGTKRIALPVPKLVVFYNGLQDTADEEYLYLRDLFPKESRDSADVTVRVRMININYGHNKELLEACKPLNEYAWLVEQIRVGCRSLSGNEEKGEAISKALTDMPDTFSIKEFLMENRAEVEMSCLTEYNEAETMDQLKKEAREEGLEEGREEGRKEGRKEGLKLSVQNVAACLMSKNAFLSEEDALKEATRMVMGDNKN